MDSALEAIAFLARSGNRVQVLRSLAAEEQTRQELREELPVARTTLARVLNELEDRGWIARTGRGYGTTPEADALLEKFVPLVETAEGLQSLGDAVDWLPPAARSLDVRHFRDADITTSTAENPAGPFDRGVEVIRAADRLRVLCSTGVPRHVVVARDRLVQDRLDFEGVVESGFPETLRDDPERAGPWRDFAEANAMSVYEGRVPVNMYLVDEMVLLWLGELREDGVVIQGLLESENPAVLSWAESLYEEYRADADPLDPARLPEP